MGETGEGQAPGPVQVPENVRAMAAAMDSAGVPRQAGEALLAKGVTRDLLGQCSMKWVLKRIESTGLEHSGEQRRNLAWLVNLNANVPLAAQSPGSQQS